MFICGAKIRAPMNLPKMNFNPVSKQPVQQIQIMPPSKNAPSSPNEAFAS
jgi:hypothetical protein